MFCVTHLFRALDFPTYPYSLRLSVRPSFSDILHNNFQGVMFRPGAGQRLVNVTMTALTKKSDSVSSSLRLSFSGDFPGPRESASAV